MKTLTVTEAAQSFASILEVVERDQEEVLLVRDNQNVARIIPEPSGSSALEVLGDLYGTLDEGTGEALFKALDLARKSASQNLNQLKNPWDS
jgi:hypothetical protein